MGRLPLWLCALAGAACALESDVRDTVRADTAAAVVLPDTAATIAFRCGDTFRFVAQLATDSAWVSLEDTSIVLPHVPGASGAQFAQGSTELAITGDTARLSTNGRVYAGCIRDAGRSPWEDARLSGVDFRAIGQEPGWTLEIREGDRITWSGNYGATRITVPAPEPVVDPESDRRTYEVETEAHRMTVVLDPTACADTMSGERFGWTVEVVVAGERYAGCGRMLR